MTKPTPKHYVIFYIPGTFVSEQTERKIGEWDTRSAMRLAQGITERHGAKPYGFRFETRIVAQDIDDGYGGKLRVEPRAIKTSALHHIKATIESYDEVVARNSPREDTLRFNMRYNDIPFVAVTTNSFRAVHPYEPGDCVVNADGSVTDRGDSEERMAYREAFSARKKAGEL